VPRRRRKHAEMRVVNMTKPGTALITGASSGIAAAYADRLAKLGYDLVLVARNEERLSAVAKQVTAESHVKVEVLTADLTSRADVRRVEERLRAALAGFDQGELVTIPSLPDAGDWNNFVAARLALGPNLSHSKPAARYGRAKTKGA